MPFILGGAFKCKNVRIFQLDRSKFNRHFASSVAVMQRWIMTRAHASNCMDFAEIDADEWHFWCVELIWIWIRFLIYCVQLTFSRFPLSPFVRWFAHSQEHIYTSYSTTSVRQQQQQHTYENVYDVIYRCVCICMFVCIIILCVCGNALYLIILISIISCLRIYLRFICAVATASTRESDWLLSLYQYYNCYYYYSYYKQPQYARAVSARTK